MLIERVTFHNFRALRDAELSLGQLTVIVGANGSGKTSALEAITAAGWPGLLIGRPIASAGNIGEVRIDIYAEHELDPVTLRFASDGSSISGLHEGSNFVKSARYYSFDPEQLRAPSVLKRENRLESGGHNLPSELDQLRDRAPERFEQLNAALPGWLPEFDRVLFETTDRGERSILLRTTEHGSKIPASELSSGALLALALLAIAYRDDPPPIICIEEPDRGVHPRVLPRVQEALYRLAYPASFGDAREPTQVIVTTHSPYFLDLFKDHPEEIVVAEKTGNSAIFHRLVDLPNSAEILEGAPLGEIWYSGILGGVPAA